LSTDSGKIRFAAGEPHTISENRNVKADIHPELFGEEKITPQAKACSLFQKYKRIFLYSPKIVVHFIDFKCCIHKECNNHEHISNQVK